VNIVVHTDTHQHQHIQKSTSNVVCIHTHARTHREQMSRHAWENEFTLPLDNFILHFGQQISYIWCTVEAYCCSLAKLFNYFIRFTLFAFSPLAYTHLHMHKKQLALSTRLIEFTTYVSVPFSSRCCQLSSIFFLFNRISYIL